MSEELILRKFYFEAPYVVGTEGFILIKVLLGLFIVVLLTEY